MSQMQITNGAPATSGEVYYVPPTARGRLQHIPSGALGEHVHALAVVAGEEGIVKRGKRVSLQEADNALRKLMGSPSDGAKPPTVRDVLDMDPMMLSIMMSTLVLKATGHNASVICQELERATEVQAELRNKQVEKYQEEINKAIEQAHKAHKGGIWAALFDWVVGAVETAVGVVKIIKGLFTCDPLAIADGAAYLAAGVAGMMKGGAELELQCGANKERCNDLINAAGKVQTVCEGVAMAMDFMQIGRGIFAARAVTKTAVEVLKTCISKVIDAVVKGVEDELKVLGEEIGREVGEDVGKALEREMVEVGDMEAENVAHEAESETNMVRSMGKSFTREGIANMVKTAIVDAGKELLKESEEVVTKKLRDTILKKLQRSIFKAVVRDCTYQALLVTKGVVGGANFISSVTVKAITAKLEKDIELLKVEQSYIDFMQDSTEDSKKTQQKRLGETYQDAANTLKIASAIIDNCGTVLAKIAGQRA